MRDCLASQSGMVCTPGSPGCVGRRGPNIPWQGPASAGTGLIPVTLSGLAAKELHTGTLNDSGVTNGLLLCRRLPRMRCRGDVAVPTDMRLTDLWVDSTRITVMLLTKQPVVK